MDGNTISYQALDILRDKLCSFLCVHLGKLYGENWVVEASRKAKIRVSLGTEGMDLAQVITLFYTHYADLKSQLPNYFPKQILNFIKSIRNIVMHQQVLGPAGAYRLVDLIKLFLDEIEAPDDRILNLRKELMKEMYQLELGGEIQVNNPGVANNTAVSIFKHYYVYASSSDVMPDLLVRILETASHSKAIVYCDTKLEYEILQSRLQNDKWDLICVDDAMDKITLQSISAILRKRHNVVLLAHGYILESDFTDKISLVVNFNIPRDITTLLQRLQVLKKCKNYPEVINFITDGDMDLIYSYQDWSNAEIQELSEDLFL